MVDRKRKKGIGRGRFGCIVLGSETLIYCSRLVLCH
jgi:hypothetical protein